MTIREQNIDRFDAYMAGRLSLDDKTAFERELKNNKTLNADFEAFKEEVNLTKTLGIRDEMSEIMERKATQKGFRPGRWFFPMAIAAAVLLLVLFIPAKPDHKVLFEENFKPFPNAISGRDFEGDFNRALNFYDRQKYKEAVRLFTKMPMSDTVAFYKSMSHLALDQPRLAIQGLRLVDGDGLFSDAVDWYLGLSYLLLNQSDSAMYYMRQVEESGQYAQGAGKVLDWADQ